MCNNIAQPKWKVVEYSRSKIIKAGKIIRNPSASKEEISNATNIIDNWRAAHAFPLHVIYMHLRRMAQSKKDVIVAERLKRLSSIILKLKREENMNLWLMQDLGGCRVIVPTIAEVYQFANDYEKARKRHIKIKENDYIRKPKIDGYRSLHIVYEYKSDKKPTYNKNMLIEIQFRTRLQHLWATAVETMGLFTDEKIKSGLGSTDAKRFFALTSALFAILEDQPIVPNVVDDLDEIVSEITMLDAKYNYLDFLSGIRIAINYKAHNNMSKSKNGYCILVLYYTEKKLSIRPYKSSQIDIANKLYSAIEKNRADTKIDAVLVRVSSFNALRSAYPNYFSDIGEFVKIVKTCISKGSE